jgi:hypothetical protein
MDNSMDFWDMFDGYVMVHGGYIYIGPTLRDKTCTNHHPMLWNVSG